MKAVTLFLNSSILYRFKKISESQFLIIGDVSSFYSFYKLKQMLVSDKPGRIAKTYHNIRSVFNKQLEILMPNSKLMIVWDFIMVFALSINLF